MRELDVYLNNTKAGVLSEKYPGSEYSFQYTAEYLNSELPPISATLPKQVKPFTAGYIFPFFSNMLPEGANRKAICRSQRIDEKDFFGLLAAMAEKDFIGAVNIRRKVND